MTPKQKDLINKLCAEISWWKELNDIKSQKRLVDEFVKHELSGLTYEQEVQVINGLTYLLLAVEDFE